MRYKPIKRKVFFSLEQRIINLKKLLRDAEDLEFNPVVIKDLKFQLEVLENERKAEKQIDNRRRLIHMKIYNIKPKEETPLTF